MRIRLSIYRHRLPPVKIWWDTRSSREPGDDLTISSFLARLSLVVPLDSSTWGLEDYVVEVDGFELLHFQNVEDICKEGDAVVVRPLSGSELRERKISGRRQISTSGRSLLDGVPFGRTLMRPPAADRPGVLIPPRKRAKYGKETPDSSIVRFRDISEDEENEYLPGRSEGSESEDFNGSEEEELESKHEEDEGEERDEEEEKQDTPDRATHATKSVALIDYYADSEGEDDDDFEPDDTAELSEDDEEDADSTAEEVAAKFKPKSYPSDELRVNNEEPWSDGEDDVEYNPVDPVDLSEDDSEDADSLVEEITTKFKIPENSSPVAVDDSDVESSDSSESDSSSESSSESDSSGENSDADDSESESEDENESSSDSESSTSDSLSDESVAEKPLKKTKRQRVVLDSQDETSANVIKSSKVSVATKPRAVAPGALPNQGSSATRARTERKKTNRKLCVLQQHGVVPEDMNIVNMRHWLDEQNLSIYTSTEEILRLHKDGLLNNATNFMARVQPKQVPATPAAEEDVREADDAEEQGIPKAIPNDAPKINQLTGKARKRARKLYQKFLKSGKITEDLSFDQWLEERQQARLSSKSDNQEDRQNEMHTDNGDIEKGTNDFVPETLLDEPNEAPTEETSKETLKRPSDHGVISDSHHRKHSQALKSSNKKWKRMQNKAATKVVYDEDGNPTEVQVGDETAYLEEEDPEAWRQKIVLSAVECEDESIGELPTPDFPFDQFQLRVRRNTTNMSKKRKRGGKKRKSKNYSEQELEYNENSASYQQYDDWIPHDFYEDKPVLEEDGAQENQVQEAEPVDDLPPLPEDMAALYPLIKPVRPGTLIAFKQMKMNENYNPIVTDYQTAMVEKVDDESDDGPFLELRLAIRDRPVKRIDPETGERILGRFEMPGAEENDEGIVEIAFSDLIEPKIVRLAEAESVEDTVNGDKPNGTGTPQEDQGPAGAESNGENGDVSGGPTEEQPDAMDEDQQPDGTNGGQQPEKESPSDDVDNDHMDRDNGQDRSFPVDDEQYDNMLLDRTGNDLPDPEIASPDISNELETGQQPSNGRNQSASLPAAQVPDLPISPQPYVHESDFAPTASGAEPTNGPAPSLGKEKRSSMEKYESDTDSDGFPSLHTIFSQPIKRESPDENRQPSLPPLPEFSPFGMEMGSMVSTADQRQILAEANNIPTSTAPPRLQGMSKARKSAAPANPRKRTSAVKVIDLTLDSSPPPESSSQKVVARPTNEENKRREFPWKAVKRRTF